MPKFTEGQKVHYRFTSSAAPERTVLVAEPDERGRIVVLSPARGRYYIGGESDYEPCPPTLAEAVQAYREARDRRGANLPGHLCHAERKAMYDALDRELADHPERMVGPTNSGGVGQEGAG